MPAVPSQRAWAVNDDLDTTNLNGFVSDPIEFLLRPPHANLRRSTTQSIATGTGVAVQMTVEDVDTDVDGIGGHSTVTNPSRYTARYPGWYQVSGGVGFAASATGRRGCWLAVNGSQVNGTYAVGPASAANSTATPGRTVEVFLNEGDFVELIGFQESGGALLVSGTTIEQPHMTARWVSK